jgi:uncharacterized protein with PIN domain
MTDGNGAGSPPRFIVDHNVGKLARWLRMMGFDCLFFTGADDGDMVRQALAEDRIIVTRDTGVARRRVATRGRVRVILLHEERPERQMQQVNAALGLPALAQPFTRCLECNAPLEPRTPEEVRNRVPPYVYRTQTRYVECPACGRIYWQGTHWEAMMRRLATLNAVP